MKRLVLFCLVMLLVITRVVGLNWGLPYLMHPDESNMIFSILQLNCSKLTLESCFNPRFFAYGQLPLYLSYLILVVCKNVFSVQVTPATAALVLRSISGIASLLTGWVFYLFLKKEFKSELSAWLGLFFYLFSPGLIQQAHFGTTEGLLTLFLMLIVYYHRRPYLQAFFVGLAAASKISALAFFIFPSLTFLQKIAKNGSRKTGRSITAALLIMILTLCLFSPHYLLNFTDFWQSFVYESAVATGKLRVFYTQQFENTPALIFQLRKIFPYALGWVLTTMSFLGMFFSNRKQAYFLFGLLFLFVTNAFLYVKWTRFIVPYLPLFIYFAVNFCQKYLLQKQVKYLLPVVLAYQLLFGAAFMRIYLTKDVRFVASAWINKHIKSGSLILSESANVVDIPLSTTQKYRYYSLFLYDLDRNSKLKKSYQQLFSKADFVFVPSRRIFANYTCYLNKDINPNSSYCRKLRAKYPLINQHYQQLFQTKNFKLIKTFSNYPKIAFFGIKLFELADEFAEETWSVFDHPVIRIYQKVG